MEAIQNAQATIAAINERAGALRTERAEAVARAKDAEARRKEAMTDKILGKGEEPYLQAVEERQEAIAVVAALAEEDEECLRLRRSEEARILQIQTTHWEDLHKHIQGTAGKGVQAAALALVGPLKQYLEAYARADREYRALHSATFQYQMDHRPSTGMLHGEESRPKHS